ncbi:SPX domain-containing protein [Phlyctochytrium arcticum]|nr:SPX domain-containing protein [Phlyctochytrium arcticum]
MKFAQSLQERAHPPWAPYYVDYKRLKKILKRLEQEHEDNSRSMSSVNAAPPDHRFTHKAIQDDFFNELEQEVDKVEWFYLECIEDLEKNLQEVVAKWFWATHHNHHKFRPPPPQSKEGTRSGSQEPEVELPIEDSAAAPAAPSIAESSLPEQFHSLRGKIEKVQANYLPLNRLAIAKILKKHDKLEQSHAGASTRQSVIERIREHRRFWDARELGKVAEEYRSFRWEVNKVRIRMGSEAVR